MGKVDDALYDDLVVFICQHVSNKGLVNLKLTDRKLSQVSQGGVAGPEIIDGDIGAEFFQAAENSMGQVRVLNKGGLGNFNGQHRTAQAVRAEDPGEDLR